MKERPQDAEQMQQWKLSHLISTEEDNSTKENRGENEKAPRRGGHKENVKCEVQVDRPTISRCVTADSRWTLKRYI